MDLRGMMTHVFIVCLSLIFQSPPLYADTLVALVVGNQDYEGEQRLDHPTNDANDIALALKQLGFRTILLTDADQAKIKDSVIALGHDLQQGDAKVGLFFYAGHGVQVEGKNYLIPLKAHIEKKSDVIQHAVDVSWVLEKMTTGKDKINIMILDACRDYRFPDASESDKRGFAQLSEKAGVLIAYSTAPGNTAEDGNEKERNSPYTKYLKNYIKERGLEIEDVFKKVRTGVRKETGDAQIPSELNTLESSFYPAGRSSDSPQLPPSPPGGNPETPTKALPGGEISRPLLPATPEFAPRKPRAYEPIKFDFTEAKEEGAWLVENTLAEDFRLHGHKVLDHGSKAKVLVIKGNFHVTRSQGPPPFDAIAVSHTDVSARVVRDGAIVGSASVTVGKAFDITGGVALEAAAHMLAVKLLDNLDTIEGGHQKPGIALHAE